MKRGEKDKNRSKYSDEILLIFGIDIVEDKHSSAINHQLPEKTCLGTEEQGGVAQSVNLVKEHMTPLFHRLMPFLEKNKT